ncbi:MAG: hydrogenase 3 maturation endopeptidase HyCI [Candidatus Omnitrophica bacterium]|nr:hydrogenase 3 maturation endopeptidase HyCI [Candidatus Omnitrophota bacterium]
MKNVFQNIFKGKVVIVGIGNTLRQDDAFGPLFIERLKGKVKAVCLDVGTAPENYTGKIAQEKPNTILLVDALHLGKSPGEYEILKKDGILKSGFSTHDISPHMFIEYLENETDADIYMLGVQPEGLSLGKDMSDSAKGALEEIAEMTIKESRLAYSSRLEAQREKPRLV